MSLGQQRTQYNLNVLNGLPSEHVYYSIVDTYGYLWLATSKGVVKYDGHSFKTYDLSDGLSNSDVWYLFQDKRKRIWLSSIASEIGYIFNGTYKKMYSCDTDARFYTSNFINTPSGIAFSNMSRKSNINGEVYIERNDTLYNFSLSGHKSANYFLNNKGKVIIEDSSRFYDIKVGTGRFKAEEICSNLLSSKERSATREYVYENYVILYNSAALSGPYVYTQSPIAIDIRNCAVRKLEFAGNRNERLSVMFPSGDNLGIITDKGIYLYDSTLKLIKYEKCDDLIQDKKISGSIISYLKNDFWGECIATVNHGYYIGYSGRKSFKKSTYQLSGYSYCGKSLAGTSYWWNKQERKLAIISGTKINYRIYNDFLDVAKIMPYDSSVSMILANNNVFLVDDKTGKLSLFFNKKKDFFHYDAGHLYPPGFQNLFRSSIGEVHINEDFFFLFHDIFMSYKLRGDTVFTNSLDIAKYKNLVYDSVNQKIWVYGDLKILIYDVATGNKVFINKNILNKYKISKIENMFIDSRYGNVFLKDFNHFFVFNYHSFRVTELFKDYVLKDAFVMLYKDKLIASGKFGVFFSKITGAGGVTKPYLCENIKGINFSYVSDEAVYDSVVTLNTDKGTYEIGIPTDKELSSTPGRLSENYKLLYAYKDSITNIFQGDTINVGQPVAFLKFDVINPAGSGQIKYEYRINREDANWENAAAGELRLANLTPGKYYSLSLILSDDVWRSRPIDLEIYIQPYWWETTSGKNILWLAGFMLLLITISIAIYVTKKIEVRRNEKANLHLGLELKSVYAQLNPHFIFNSLNLTQYLISKNKSDAAYTHISKFSALLRAYLKSSRNRFISIGEECKNLSNYMDLQQLRFDNAFSYEIVIDVLIQTNATLIPSLLLQPLVENAINHGLIPKGRGGHLKIEFIRVAKGGAILCIIEDNGIGRKKSMEDNNKEYSVNQSFGTSLTSELIEIFNKYEHSGIRLTYIDKEQPHNGTIIKIEIKNPRYNDQ